MKYLPLSKLAPAMHSLAGRGAFLFAKDSLVGFIPMGAIKASQAVFIDVGRYDPLTELVWLENFDRDLQACRTFKIADCCVQVPIAPDAPPEVADPLGMAVYFLVSSLAKRKALLSYFPDLYEEFARNKQ